MTSIRIQSIVNTNESLQITYVQESDIHEGSGIMEARTVDIPHAALPQVLVDDLIDSAQTIIEHARIIRRQPEEQFTR